MASEKLDMQHDTQDNRFEDKDTFLSKLITGRTDFPFMSWSKISLGLAVALIVLSAGALAVRGLNLSLEFTGGTAFQVENATNTTWTVPELEDVVEEFGITDLIVQKVDEGKGAQISTVSLESIEEVDENDVANKISEFIKGDVSISAVGPSWGAKVTEQALFALLVFVTLIILYLSVRFEWRMAIAAVLALFHDIFVGLGMYALFQWTVSPATVTAFLTIMGYSLYDTVVVFDRLNEVAATHGRRIRWAESTDEAINHVLVRSISISITSLLPVLSLIFIGSGLLGATTLIDLSLALAIGMTLGVYSSIGIAAPLLVWFKTKKLGGELAK